MEATGVVIVGAGPTGLSMALEAARFGVPFRIVDRSAEPAGGSRAVALHARTLELLEAAHLTEKLLPFGHRIAGARTISASGSPADVSFADLPSDYPFAAIVPQDVTERAMIVRLHELGITIERSTQLVRLTQEDDAVHAVLEGPDGTETIRAAFVAGCDGRDSTVRALVDAGLAEERPAERYAIADAVLRTALPGDRIVVGGARDGVRFVAIPLPDGLWRLTFGPSSLTAPPDAAALEAALTAAGIATHIQAIDWSALYEVRPRRVARYRCGRVFLLGDAAHAQSPLGGQGLDTAIGDGINLAWKLAAVLTAGAPETLLDTYHEEREPVARALAADAVPTDASDLAGLSLAYPASRLSSNVEPLTGALRAGMRVRGHRPAGIVPQTVVAPAVEGRGAMTVVLRPDGYAGFVAPGARPDEAARYLRDVIGIAAAAAP